MGHGTIASRVSIRRSRRPQHGGTFLAREPGGLAVDRRRCRRPASGRRKPKPMMHDREKSDSPIVVTKPTNGGGRLPSEPEERRGGAEGNARQPSMLRTPSRDSVTASLERVRTASPSTTQGGSRMREFRSYGSVRGARSNARPYRDPQLSQSPIATKCDRPRPSFRAATQTMPSTPNGVPLQLARKKTTILERGDRDGRGANAAALPHRLLLAGTRSRS
jgi:hypothetical protein